MIIIKQEAYAAMLEHARGSTVEMACGIVSGRLEGGKRIVHRFHPIVNAAHSRDKFSLDRAELSRAMTSLTKIGGSTVGTWFCHRDSGAVMTPYEIQTAHDRDGSYLVLSLAGSEPVLRSYRVWGGRADEEELFIEP